MKKRTGEKSDTAVHPAKRLTEILSVLKRHEITKGLTPVKLREIFEDLGPAYVKIGQVMSMRSDLLPAEYCKELSHLRSDAAGIPYAEVLGILKEELHRSPEDLFSFIEEKPLGSASIAQVHAAVLKDGRKAVIKVARPGIHDIMQNDIALLRKASGLIKIGMGTGGLVDFQAVIEEIWKTSQEEMDFRKEADNLERFRKNQEGIVYVTCPEVFRELSAESVLVMSNVGGLPIDSRKELLNQGYDFEEIAAKLAEDYCRQILHDGFFHADPHPGNLRISDGRIAWIDLGMAGEISDNLRHVIKTAVEAVINEDMYSLTNAFLCVGKPEGEVDRAHLYNEIDTFVRRYRSMEFGSMNLADLFAEGMNIIKDNRIGIPAELTTLYRSMVTIEGTLSLISPDVNLLEILKVYLKNERRSEINVKDELLKNIRLSYLTSQKMLELPAQFSDFLNLAKSGDLSVSIRGEGNEKKLETLDRMSKRITVSVLILALYLYSGLTLSAGPESAAGKILWPSYTALFLGSVLLILLLIKLIKEMFSHE